MSEQKLITLDQLTNLAERVKSTTDELDGEVTAIGSTYIPKEEGKSLIEDTLIQKLSGISENADHVEHSETNGSIKVDSSDVVVYDVKQDIATEGEFSDALKDLFQDAVPIGESAVDIEKTDYGEFGKTTDFYNGDIGRTWIGSTCTVTGTLKHLGESEKTQHAGLWTEGSFFAVSLDNKSFSDKEIIWTHGEHINTGKVGDVDLVCHLTDESKLFPIVAECNGRLIATFDVSGLTLESSEDP